MALPDLFSSMYIGFIQDEKEFVAHFTNPIKSVLEEAGKVFDDTTKVTCIPSLGSGTNPVKGLRDDPQPDDRMTMLATIAENCETAHQEAMSRYDHSGICHRINVERDYLCASRDEWEEDLILISQATHSHLQANERASDRLIDLFNRPVGGPMIRDLSLFGLIALFFDWLTP
jgi:hypothetical protein